MNQFSLMATAIFSSVAFASASAMAQAAVTGPSATVPPVVYQSVFNQSPIGVETQSVDWKKANADVAQFPRGHVDILKWEKAQIKTKPVAKPVATPAETQAAPTAPAVPSAAHKH